MSRITQYILALIITFGMFACGPNANDIIDQYITNIKGDIVVLASGETYKLPVTDSSHIFYLVRHAEVDATNALSDKQLSAQGIKRGELLYDIFRSTDLDDIYSTITMRTISTAETVSGEKGMNIKPYDARNLRDLYSTIIDSTDARRVLIIGHSNTTPVLANFLYGEQYFTSSFDEKDYDNLVIVIDNKSKGKEILPVKFKP